MHPSNWTLLLQYVCTAVCLCCPHVWPSTHLVVTSTSFNRLHTPTQHGFWCCVAAVCGACRAMFCSFVWVFGSLAAVSSRCHCGEALGAAHLPNLAQLVRQAELCSTAVQAVAQSNVEGTSEHGSNAAANAGAAVAEGQITGSTQTAAPVLVIQASACTKWFNSLTMPVALLML